MENSTASVFTDLVTNFSLKYEMNATTMVSMTTTTMMSMTTDAGSGNQGWGVGPIESNIAVRIVYGLIAMTGIMGNALVIFALLRIASLRTRTSHFIMHLALADLLTSTWVIPFHLFPTAPTVANNFGGEIVCRLYSNKFPLWCTIFTSVYSLVNVTLERYVAVVHPIKYKTMFSVRMSAVMMLATWFIGFMSNIYFFWIYDAVDGACTFVGYSSPAGRIIIGLYTLAVVYIIPAVITLLCHRQMIVALKKQLDSLRQERREKRASGEKAKRDANAWQLKATQEIQKTLMVVLITYMICWAPNQFIFFAFNMGAPVDFTQPYYHASVIFAICNSCVNPFIYVYKNKYFRRGLLEALGCPEGVMSFINRIGPVSTGTGGRETPTNTLDEQNQPRQVGNVSTAHNSTNDSLV